MAKCIEKHSNDFTTGCRVRRNFGEHLPKIQGGTILDCGCSHGMTTLELADKYRFSQVIGIDCKRDRVPNKHPAYGSVSFQEGDFYRLAKLFRKESARAIFVMNNLLIIAPKLSLDEHLEIADDLNFVLEEGGILAFSYTGDCAVLRKNGRRFEQEHVDENLRNEGCYGWFPKVYGLV